MNQEQIAALAKGLAPVVRECVAAATAPLLEQIDALEKKLLSLPVPRDGKDADEEAVAARVAEKVAAELAEIRSAVDAIEPAPELPDVAGMIAEAIQPLTEQREKDAAQIQQWMDGIDGRFETLPVPENGKDADPEEMRAAVVAEVERAVAGLPKPEDGKSVTIEDVEPLIAEQVTAAVGEAIKAIPVPRDGKDGVGLAGALIDRAGNLVLTLTDGTQRDLGAVVGKDGDPGKDGADGLGFDDMDMVIAEDGAALVFTRGEHRKAFALPIVFDRGVFRAETSYRKGNGVTWGGQFWIAQKDNPEGKPDASSDWRLAVKKGRDASRHAAKVEV